MKFEKRERRLTALVLMALMGLGMCGTASAEEQTGTTFTKGQIDGQGYGFSSSNDFKKYNVWDGATKTYTFTKDSTLNTKSITGNSADVNVNAPDVTLTLNSKENLGIQSYRGRGYKADPNYYANLHNVNITAKKVIVNVDRTSRPHAEDSYGIISGSSNHKTVRVNGDVEVNIASKYWKAPTGDGDIDPAVTCGIGTLNHGHVVINGNATIRVRVPEQSGASFLSHYYVSGISAMLNYDGDTPGGNVLVTGDVDIESDGTGVRAGTRSTVTIGGGGKININRDHNIPHFALNAEEATVNMNVKLDKDGNVIGAGSRKTEIYGNVGLIDREGTATTFGNTPTRINLGLTTADSVMKGIVLDHYKEKGKTGATEPDKKAIREASGFNLYLQNGAAWHNASWGAMMGTTFTGSKLRSLHGGVDADHAGRIFQKDARSITINHYDGFTNVCYDRTAPDATTLVGGDFVVKNAAAGSGVTLRTSGNGLDTSKYKEALESLAHKFYYEGYKSGEKNITGRAEIAEGAITPWARRMLSYDDATGQAMLGAAVPDENRITYGPKETLIMSSAKSAMAASAMAFRAEANDLMKRMGDLRLSPEQTGTWVRFYRGKTGSDKDNTNFHMNYHTVQVGHDLQVSPQWRVGLAASYMKGSAGFANGSGKSKEGNLGIYGTWTGKSGDYVDLIAKVGRLGTEYSVYNTSGDIVRGDCHTWAETISAEYGKRIKYKGGNFIEPQAELIYTHLNGVDYKASLNGAANALSIRQGAMNSLIGRIGIGVGQETARSTVFAKLSLYHEFSGDMKTTFSDSVNTNRASQEFKDTWVGAQIGGTLKLSDKCSVYGDFEKTFGGDIKTDWRVDAGIRWGF
ncbi:autotransporter outer membrane beta-barrel domain-containing protein [Selenomonas artemidis]|uniref:autotransporter outer membrane beta-barrel domain-containing protein n=1 Tax=Selenomonas artemidis TaxID=671224 RepID=UPI0023F34F6C|nr:autotransporter outer membrane beta-barrel domain-containing protein [Selenomonas artemidis]